MHELAGEVEALPRRVVHLRGRPVVGDRSSGEVADRDADVLVTEVEADRERRVGNEREEDRRPAGHPWAFLGLLVLLDHPGLA